MHGIGFLTAITLIIEIVKSQSSIFLASFGIDPGVNESGKLEGDRNKLLKRSARFGMRILFAASLASIRTTRIGDAINLVLRD